MNSRTALIAAITVTILGSLYILHTSSTTTLPMSSGASGGASKLAHLEFSLSQISKSPPSLLVTLRNTHPTSTFTILKWDTPLDTQAFNLGVFALWDADSREKIDIPRLMINRKLPPSRDALQEIAPGEEYSTEVVLDKPWMPAKQAKYKVRAEGSFKAVWEKSARDVEEADLKELGGGSAALTGDFEAKEVMLEVQ